MAKQVADMFGLKTDNMNPYMNNVAQLVEAAHVVEASLEIIDKLLVKASSYLTITDNPDE